MNIFEAKARNVRGILQQVWKQRMTDAEPGGAIIYNEIESANQVPILELLFQKESGHAFSVQMTFEQWTLLKKNMDAALTAFHMKLPPDTPEVKQ